MINLLLLLFLFPDLQNFLFICLHFNFHLTQLGLKIIVLNPQLIKIRKKHSVFLNLINLPLSYDECPPPFF